MGTGAKTAAHASVPHGQVVASPRRVLALNACTDGENWFEPQWRSNLSDIYHRATVVAGIGPAGSV